MNLTEEEKEKANAEFQEIIRWRITEGDKLMQRLKDEGKYMPGLDSNREAFIPLDEEAKRKIKELKAKYDIE